MSTPNTVTIRWLYGQWLLAVGSGIALSSFCARFLALHWGDAASTRWFVTSGTVLVVEFGILWWFLLENKPSDGDLRAWLGLPNALTLSRGMLIAFVAGFLAVPKPTGTLSVVPGILYGITVVIDFFDGFVARRTARTTLLGERLDIEFDALGLLVVSLLGVVWGVLPIPYLAVGVARYVFVAGCWFRRQRDKPVHALPPSQERRILAVTQMLVVTSALLSLFDPLLMQVIATISLVPFLVGFVRDWLIVTGRHRTGESRVYYDSRS